MNTKTAGFRISTIGGELSARKAEINSNTDALRIIAECLARNSKVKKALAKTGERLADVVEVVESVDHYLRQQAPATYHADGDFPAAYAIAARAKICIVENECVERAYACYQI